MADGGNPDPIRRDVVAGAVALSFTSGVVAAFARSRSLDGSALAGEPAPTTAGPTTTLSGPAQTTATTDIVSEVADQPPTTTEPKRQPPGIPRAVLSDDERRLHVARRLSFGATHDLIAHIESVGIEGYITEQLNPQAIDDRACERMLAPLQAFRASATDIDRAESRALLSQPTGQALDELRIATLIRAVHSRRQLYEVMVHFWSDHFNIDPARMRALRAEKPVDDRDVVRRHALGRFRDLLQASGHSPAMLRYLDNDKSRAEEPNENYARELLELHTVGVGNYNETDVAGAARVFSGWGIDDDHRFAFNPRHHAAEPATVAGWSTDGSHGVRDGERLLTHLASHPETARHLATKLARRFVADEPPAGLIERLTRVYLDNDTDVRPVLAALFTSEEFFSSFGSKLRRPVEFAANTLRITGATITARDLDQIRALLRHVDAMGQPLFAWPSPDGYPDRASAWLAPNDVMGRWQFAQRLVHGHVDGTAIDLSDLHGNTRGRTVGDIATRVVARVLPGGAPAHVRDAIIAVTGRGPDEALDDDAHRHLPTMVAAALCAAEAQYR